MVGVSTPMDVCHSYSGDSDSLVILEGLNLNIMATLKSDRRKLRRASRGPYNQYLRESEPLDHVPNTSNRTLRL